MKVADSVSNLAREVFRAANKGNCLRTLERNADRVAYFKQRLVANNKADQMVIVILNVDDEHGGPLADILMRGNNWQEIRAKGETPFARGTAERIYIQSVLDLFDNDAATKLRDMTGLVVVVIDYGVADVFPV